MTDLPTEPDSAGDSADDAHDTPRWVYVSGIVTVILVLVFVIVHLAGGGFGHHGP